MLTSLKSANKRQRNACSNFAPLERTVLRTRSVTKTKKLETKASSHEGQCRILSRAYAAIREWS